MLKSRTDTCADIIDVNVGAVGVDEEEMLSRAVKKVMEVTTRPICIDSANPDAIKKALEVYPYKALINSVNGEEKSMEKILPRNAKNYHGMKKQNLEVRTKFISSFCLRHLQ